MKRLIFIVFILLSFGVKAQNYSSSGRPAGLTSFSPTWGINAFSPDSGKSIWMSFGTKWFRIPTFVQSKYFDSNFRLSADSVHLADNIHIGISTIPAWNSVYKVLNMAGNVGIRSHTGAHDLGLFNNLYNTTGSTTWHYSATGRGSLFYLDNSGGMNFYTAAPGTSADSVVLASPIFSVTPNGATLTTLPDTTAIDTIVGIHSGKLYKTPFTGGGSDSTIYKADGMITDAVRTVTLKANSDLYIGDITSGNGFHLQRLADSSMYAAIVGGDKTGNTYGTFYAGSDGGITAEAASGSTDRYIRIGPGALTGGGGMLIHDSDNIGLQNNADYSTNERLNRNALASIKAVIGIADSVKSTISGGGVTSFNSRTGAVVPVAGDYSGLTETLTHKDLTSGTNTFPTLNQNTTGQAGSVANALTNGSGLLSFSFNGGTAGIQAAVDTNYVGLAQDMILSGMGITLSGTTATVAAGSYRLNQATHSVSSTGVTIPAQDATLNRYTLIIGNTSGTLSAINGTLATDAVVPALPSNDILISTIYIPSVASGGGATSGGGAGKGTTTNSLNGGYGIVPFSFNGGTSGIKVVSDTTKIQTIANYYPKGDLRYYKATNPSNYIALSALSATSPIFYNSSTGVISSQAASASQNGYLTSTDWSTFNGKLSSNQTISFAPTGDVTGSTTGTTSLAPALSIGAGKVTNTMLAGSIDLTSKVTGILPVANGGTGTASPGIVAGTNVTVTGTWPNQTINATGGSSLTAGRGILLPSTAIILDTTQNYTWLKAQTVTKNAIATTSTDAFNLLNTTASTSGAPNQYAPALHWKAHVWNTTSVATDNQSDWQNYVTTTSANSPLSTMTWASSLSTTNTPSYTVRMSLRSDGLLTIPGNTTINGNLTTLGTFTEGNGTTTSDFILNGSNSGTSGGAGYFVQNNGVNIIEMGNYSSILGGSYNATPLINASNPITINQSINVAGGASFGNGTSNAVVMNGGNSGTNGGGAIYVQNNGTNIIAIGNKSNISTGAYNATPLIWANAGISFNQSINIESAQTTVNGSTSGTAIYSQPFQGSTYKKTIVYLNALNGTASYTFPTAFSQTPQIVATNGPAAAIVTSLSTTAITCTGSTTTGFIILEGY